MFNPPHPGEILLSLWLEPMGLNMTQTAKRLNVSRKTVSELVNGKSRLSTEMALRLEHVFGKSAESWLAAQMAYDLHKMTSRHHPKTSANRVRSSSHHLS